MSNFLRYALETRHAPRARGAYRRSLRRRVTGARRLDVQREGPLLPALLDLELQRAVLGVLERQLEEQHRAGGRPQLGDAADLRDAFLGVERLRVVGELVVRRERLGVERVVLVVAHGELGRRRAGVLRHVANLEEDAVE